VKRRLGAVRQPGSRDGLTRAGAEAELRRLMGATTVARRPGERIDVAEVGRRYLAHAERAGRKPSTLRNVESELRVHLVPFLGGRSLDAVRPEDVADLVSALEVRGLAPKTIANVVGTLSALFNFARRRRWATANPCDGAELPAVPEATEIRFLTLPEVDALVAHARPGEFRELDAAMYVTAAMTGLRLGELLALRWMDVDWAAARVRVRRNFVMGHYGTPKSRRSTRSVPMADEVGGALDRHFQASAFQADGDLVFGHPLTGEPMYRQGVTRRLHRALRAAGVGDHTFHHLRHTFGTRMAGAGVPIRTLMEWMGHRDIATTMRYADYAPGARDAEMVALAFARTGDAQRALGASRATP
jgi:integrase